MQTDATASWLSPFSTMMASASEYSTLKEQKEAFVTGHDGTFVLELLLICGSAPIGIWLWARLHPGATRNQILAEALFVLFPMLLVQTNHLYPWGITVLGFEVVAALWLTVSQEQQPTGQDTFKRLPSLTCYRSAVLFLTCIAVLAVDFNVFPRRLAKTEIYGYGLMDLGAASFVISAGLLPKQSATGATKRLMPLLFMGVLRFVTNKSVDYQEHMSEYGIHWNFFLTLAVVMPLGSLCICSVLESHLWFLPVAFMTSYQYLLSSGLQDYIETAPRQCADPNDPLCDMFAANREGILGCIGYLSLFLASHCIGQWCLWSTATASQRQARLFVASAAFWILHAILSTQISASRRSTNVTFCVWTLAHNVLLLGLLQACCGDEVPPVFDSINRHGLLVFVVANLLTGLVNITINTLQVGDGVAMLILIAYLGAVCGFALLLDSRWSVLRLKED